MSDTLKIYEQTTWQDGRETPINADALNKIENGIGAVTNNVINLNTSVNSIKSDVENLKASDVTINEKIDNLKNSLNILKLDGGTTAKLSQLGLL